MYESHDGPYRPALESYHYHLNACKRPTMAYKYLKLRDWIPVEKLYWLELCGNPNAIGLLERSCEKSKSGCMYTGTATGDILWDALSSNPNAVHLLKQYPERVDLQFLSLNFNAIDMLEKAVASLTRPINRYEWDYWKYLSANPNAVPLLKKYPDLIHWDILSMNPNAMDMLEENINKISWSYLNDNPHPRALELLQENPERIEYYYGICCNVNGMKIVRQVFEKYPDAHFCGRMSSNPSAVPILEKYPYLIDWDFLSQNPNAIHLLEQNQDKIDWFAFSENPSIFTYDYNKLRQRMADSGIAAELFAKVATRE